MESKLKMKYKQVFFIWLLANAFLISGLLVFAVYEMFSGGGSKDDLSILFWVAGLGILVTLPSLCIMLLFHLFFTKKAKDVTRYQMPYIALIICINMVYLLFGRYVYDMTKEFDVFYIGSTLAGLLAFYLVDRKIKKTAVNY